MFIDLREDDQRNDPKPEIITSIESLRGKYKGVIFTDEFMAQKQNEKTLED